MVQGHLFLGALVRPFPRSAEAPGMLLRRFRFRARLAELHPRFGLRTLRGVRFRLGFVLAYPE